MRNVMFPGFANIQQHGVRCVRKQCADVHRGNVADATQEAIRG